MWVANNVCWKNLDSNEKRNGTDWSDRLWQRNPERFNGLCQKHFGNTYQTFYEDRSPEKIEAFLKEYYEDEKQYWEDETQQYIKELNQLCRTDYSISDFIDEPKENPA